MPSTSRLRVVERTDQGPPKWWHVHGVKADLLRVSTFRMGDPRNLMLPPPRELKIGTNKAHLHCEEFPDRPEYWKITWHLTWLEEVPGIPTEYVSGVRIISQHNLAVLFDQRNDPELEKVAKEAGVDADVYSPGVFIRRGPYLNVPCPGTRQDGDPNLSLYLHNEIKEAAEALLARTRSRG